MLGTVSQLLPRGVARTSSLLLLAHSFPSFDFALSSEANENYREPMTLRTRLVQALGGHSLPQPALWTAQTPHPSGAIGGARPGLSSVLRASHSGPRSSSQPHRQGQPLRGTSLGLSHFLLVGKAARWQVSAAR